MHLKPAEYVIHVFGSIRKVAFAIGRTPTAVSHWKRSKSRKGMDGFIPRIAQQLILTAAKERKLDIRPEDLVNGRSVKKI